MLHCVTVLLLTGLAIGEGTGNVSSSNTTCHLNTISDSHLQTALIEVFPFQDGSQLQTDLTGLLGDAKERLQQLDIPTDLNVFCNKKEGDIAEFFMLAVLGNFARDEDSVATIKSNSVTGRLTRIDNIASMRTNLFEILVLVSLISIANCFIVMYQTKTTHDNDMSSMELESKMRLARLSQENSQFKERFENLLREYEYLKSHMKNRDKEESVLNTSMKNRLLD